MPTNPEKQATCSPSLKAFEESENQGGIASPFYDRYSAVTAAFRLVIDPIQNLDPCSQFELLFETASLAHERAEVIAVSNGAASLIRPALLEAMEALYGARNTIDRVPTEPERVES